MRKRESFPRRLNVSLRVAHGSVTKPRPLMLFDTLLNTLFSTAMKRPHAQVDGSSIVVDTVAVSVQNKYMILYIEMFLNARSDFYRFS